MTAVTAVGLGPSNQRNISMGAYDLIRNAPIVFVRTMRHPAAQELAASGVQLKPLDSIYESSDSFEEVYCKIVDTLLDAASDGDVVYAVPGHPLVGEESVRILIKEARRRGIGVNVVGSESFIEAALEALELSLDSGLKIIDALSMDEVTPAWDVGNLIYQVYDREIASKVKLKLMEKYPDDYEVTLVIGAGTDDAKVLKIPLFEIDRCECDHLTTLYIPPWMAVR